MFKRLGKNSLAKGAGIYLGTSIINAAIPLALLPILTRYLTPSEYGEVGIFQILLVIFGALCGLSVPGAAKRKYYDFGEEGTGFSEFVGSCVLLLIVSSLLLLAIVYLLSPSLSKWLGISEFFLILAVPVAASNFFVLLRLGQWQIRKAALKFGLFQISKSSLNMLVTIVFVVLFSMESAGRIYGLSIAYAVFAALALFYLNKDGLIRLSWRPDYIKEALHFGVPLIPHMIGVFLLFSIDRAILGNVLGLEEVGYYVVAAQMAGALGLVMDSFNKAYMPWLFDRLQRNVWSEKVFIVKLTYLYYLVAFIPVILSFSLGEYFITLIAGPRYAPAAEVVSWLFLAQAFRGMYLMVTNYIFYSKRTSVIASITISTGVLHVVLTINFVQLYGVVGAGYSLCISMFLQWIATWYFTTKLMSMPWLYLFKRNNRV